MGIAARLGLKLFTILLIFHIEPFVKMGIAARLGLKLFTILLIFHIEPFVEMGIAARLGLKREEEVRGLVQLPGRNGDRSPPGIETYGVDPHWFKDDRSKWGSQPAWD